jgi:hypothetical protein
MARTLWAATPWGTSFSCSMRRRVLNVAEFERAQVAMEYD